MTPEDHARLYPHACKLCGYAWADRLVLRAHVTGPEHRTRVTREALAALGMCPVRSDLVVNLLRSAGFHPRVRVTSIERDTSASEPQRWFPGWVVEVVEAACAEAKAQGYREFPASWRVPAAVRALAHNPEARATSAVLWQTSRGALVDFVRELGAACAVTGVPRRRNRTTRPP